MSKDTGKSEMREANRLMRDNIARLEAIGVPTIEAQKIALETPELVGMLEAEVLGPSAFEQVQEDPRLRMAQIQALSDMTELAQTGLGAEDKAALSQIRRDVAAQRQAEAATALQQMQERGMGDSGAALMAQLQAGQQAGQRQAQQAEAQAAQAAAARRAAIGQQANMASQMSQQQLALAGQKASAKDVINQFNTQNRQSVAARNLAERQRIAEAGTAARNQQQMYNTGLIQQQFQNEIAKAGGVTGGQTALANLYGQQAAAAQQANQAMTTAIIQGGATVAAGMASDKNLKTNIEPFSSDEFLDKLISYKYDYKNEEDGRGKQAGVMAQDLENTEVGKQAVIDTPRGKIVDYNKLGPTMLSSLVDINKRLKKIEGK